MIDRKKTITVCQRQLSIYSYLWISFLPLIVCIQGYIYGPGGVNYLVNIYALLTIMIFSTVLLSYKAPRDFYYAIGLILLFLLIITIRGLYIDVVMIRDYFLIIRAWLLFVIVYYFLNRYVCLDKKIKYTRRLFLFFWLFVSVSIVLSKYFQIGLYTYPIFSSGYKFWFPATNELGFLIFTSYIVIHYLSNSFVLKMLFFVVTIYVFMVLGTKIFIVFFAVFLFFNALFQCKNRYGLTAVVFFVFSNVLLLGLVLINFDTITVSLSEALMKFSEGAGKFEVKLKEVGVVSTVLGERDYLVKLGISYINEYFSLSDALFGKTVTVFLAEFSDYRNVDSFGMVENDLVDLFSVYGIFFVFAYLTFLYKISNIRNLFVRGKINNRDKVIITQGVIMFVTGALSGHVLFFTLPMVVSAVIFGTLRDKQAVSVS